jgi:hypothetical protein
LSAGSYRAINNYLDKRAFEIGTYIHKFSRMHGSIFGCMYLFQFKFGNFYRNLTKQATVLYVVYVHSPLLKTLLTKVKFNDESFVLMLKPVTVV